MARVDGLSISIDLISPPLQVLLVMADHQSPSQNPLAEPRRINSLDAARAVAALLVVCEHSLEKTIPRFAPGVPILNLGQTGVVCFFLISGFVIPYSLQSHGSLLKYAIARFFRIFPLYWFVLIITTVLLWVKAPGFGTDAGGVPSWHSFLVHVFMIQSLFKTPNLVGISWTLVIEIVFYFIIAFVFLIKPASLIRLIIAGCVLVLGAAVFGWYLHKSLPIYPAALILTAFAGQAIEYFWSSRITKIEAGLLFIGVLLTCLVSISIRESTSPYSIDAKTVCVSWPVGYACFLVFLASRHKSNALSFLGRISYSIYLLHPVFIAFLFSVFSTSWGVFVTCIIGTCAVSFLTFTFIEKPGIAFGRDLFKRILGAKLRRKLS